MSEVRVHEQVSNTKNQITLLKEPTADDLGGAQMGVTEPNPSSMSDAMQEVLADYTGTKDRTQVDEECAKGFEFSFLDKAATDTPPKDLLAYLKTRLPRLVRYAEKLTEA